MTDLRTTPNTDRDGETGAALSRRDLLKLGAAAPAAAAAAAVGGGAAEAAEPATSLGMTKTEHVKKYLASARF